jgi:hypothetical protein
MLPATSRHGHAPGRQVIILRDWIARGSTSPDISRTEVLLPKLRFISLVEPEVIRARPGRPAVRQVDAGDGRGRYSRGEESAMLGLSYLSGEGSALRWCGCVGSARLGCSRRGLELGLFAGLAEAVVVVILHPPRCCWLGQVDFRWVVDGWCRCPVLPLLRMSAFRADVGIIEMGRVGISQWGNSLLVHNRLWRGANRDWRPGQLLGLLLVHSF